MPIRINLLAEIQAAEDSRRRDPVKRAMFVAGTIVCLAAAWVGTLQFKVIRFKGQLNELADNWRSSEGPYLNTVETRRQFFEAEGRLNALTQLTTNRFLWGTALNALQLSLAAVDDVQFVRFKTEQVYIVSADAKPRPGEPASGKVATATEKITMLIEAIDSSPQPGARVGKFKESIANVPWFQAHLQPTNGVLLNSLSAPQVSPVGRNTFVTFTLNCYFPEKVR